MTGLFLTHPSLNICHFPPLGKVTWHQPGSSAINKTGVEFPYGTDGKCRRCPTVLPWSPVIYALLYGYQCRALPLRCLGAPGPVIQHAPKEIVSRLLTYLRSIFPRSINADNTIMYTVHWERNRSLQTLQAVLDNITVVFHAIDKSWINSINSIYYRDFDRITLLLHRLLLETGELLLTRWWRHTHGG